MQLPAKATFEQAAELAAGLPAAVAAGSGTLRVDASALTQYDSSTIALMLQARRLAAGRGRGFEVVGVPAKLLELAKLYGLQDLLCLADGDGPAAASTPTPG